MQQAYGLMVPAPSHLSYLLCHTASLWHWMTFDSAVLFWLMEDRPLILQHWRTPPKHCHNSNWWQTDCPMAFRNPLSFAVLFWFMTDRLCYGIRGPPWALQYFQPTMDRLFLWHWRTPFALPYSSVQDFLLISNLWHCRPPFCIVVLCPSQDHFLNSHLQHCSTPFFIAVVLPRPSSRHNLLDLYIWARSKFMVSVSCSDTSQDPSLGRLEAHPYHCTCIWTVSIDPSRSLISLHNMNFWWEKSIMRHYYKILKDHNFMNTKAFWGMKKVIYFIYHIMKLSWAVSVF